MSLLWLSDRQRGELEELVSQTPSAKERCRAQALLWIAEGSDVAEVAELLKVSRQTIYNWLGRFQQRDCILCDAPADELSDRRQHPLKAISRSDECAVGQAVAMGAHKLRQCGTGRRLARDDTQKN